MSYVHIRLIDEALFQSSYRPIPMWAAQIGLTGNGGLIVLQDWICGLTFNFDEKGEVK